MHHRYLFFGILSVSFFLFSAHSATQSDQSKLKLGDFLPPLAGQTLTGKWLNVAAVSSANRSVVVFSFSRAGGRDAQLWTQRLAELDPHLAIYTVIFLGSVPSLFRTMAVSGIKNGMPLALQDRTILLYRDENLWEKRLQIANEDRACVVLRSSTGQIQWMTTGPFADVLYLEFNKQIRSVN